MLAFFLGGIFNMKVYKHICIVIVLLVLSSQAVWAAPAKSVLQKNWYSQTAEKVRIVFAVNELPEYTAKLAENPDQIVIDFTNTTNSTKLPTVLLNDDAVSNFQITEVQPDKQQVVINLKTPAVTYKVFTLANPNRVVIDIIKTVDRKYEEQIGPGLKYTSLFRTTKAGPISAYVLDLTPGNSYTMKPVLSNDSIADLEKVQSMAERNKAIAAINASYFIPNGEIIGLLKMNDQIVSTPNLARTALGILPEGQMIFDQIDYKGSIMLADGRTVAITGVNHERGEDDLILYNNYYDSTTKTNEYGTDYIVSKDIITAIAHGNAAIPPGAVVLSAHGSNEKALAGLKVGDVVKITQSLGPVWDKAIFAISAGPRLVKNNSVFLTTKEEEFPPDIAVGRAPRTAVGVTKDGHVLLVVVDGRHQNSIGMTLLELALFMQEFGAVDAMNLDGGGSSEMVLKGKIMNKPSDGHERPVGDALIIAPKD
jgi:exopolysaccharide biosynthesis protein